MAQPVTKVPYREMNNHKQGRSGSKVPMLSGPAKGAARMNPRKGGGINRPTQSR